MAGEKYAVDGAKIFCTGCAVSSEIKALNNQTVKVQTKNVCNELDKQPTNIKFSTCSFVKTCQPKLTVWNNPSSRTTASKSKALLDDASIPCLAGGMVSFVVPQNVGQTMNSTSLTEKLLKKLFKELLKEVIKDAENIAKNLKIKLSDLNSSIADAQTALSNAVNKAKEAAENYASAESKAIAGGLYTTAQNEAEKLGKMVGELEETIKQTENTINNTIDGIKKLKFGEKLLKGGFALKDSIDLIYAKDDKAIMEILLSSAAGTAIGLLLVGTPVGWVIAGSGAVLASLGTKIAFEKGVEELEKRGIKFGESNWKDAFIDKTPAIDTNQTDFCPPPNPDGSGVCIVIHGAGNGTPKI